jgi:sugar phosphate isomerase/epimerase
MIRREFVTNLTATFLGAPWLLNEFFVSGSFKVPLGIILNTVRKEMEEDYRGTLRKLKDFGYQYLEGSYYGPSAREYKQYIDELGLKCIGGGSSFGNLDKELEQYINTARELEYEYIVCYYPWLTSNDEIDLPASYQAAEELNRLGKAINQAGFEFLWHPHNWEFIPREGGQRPFDILMQHTDPDYVSLQLDLYWVAKGGGDAIEEMKRYPGRTKMFHIKDMSRDDEKKIVCVGEGQIDFQPILQYAADHQIKYWFVENETPNSSIDCAEDALTHINKLF